MPDLIEKLLIPLLLLAGQLWLNSNFKAYEARRDAEKQERDSRHTIEAQWRADVDRRIKLLMDNQAANTRADIIHKCHRYLDDLGCCSLEERDALNAQWKDYCEFCELNNVENNFIDNLVKQVMDLPTRAGRRGGVDCAEDIHKEEQ